MAYGSPTCTTSPHILILSVRPCQPIECGQSSHLFFPLCSSWKICVTASPSTTTSTNTTITTYITTSVTGTAARHWSIPVNLFQPLCNSNDAVWPPLTHSTVSFPEATISSLFISTCFNIRRLFCWRKIKSPANNPTSFFWPSVCTLCYFLGLSAHNTLALTSFLMFSLFSICPFLHLPIPISSCCCLSIVKFSLIFENAAISDCSGDHNTIKYIRLFK